VHDIIAYRGDRSACWWYRIHLPLVYLARNNRDRFNVTIASSISKDHIGKFKLAILQRQYKYEVLAPVLEMKKKGTKLVFEIDDDLFNIPKWNPASKVLSTAKVRKGLMAFLSRVDAIFVTSEALKRAYTDYCDHVYVLPNSIDFENIYNYPKDSVKNNVMWQGSNTHERDLAIAKAGMVQVAQDPDVCLKMWCGFNQQTRAPLFDIPNARTLPLVPFEGFFQMFSQIDVDVGLAPLTATLFNKGKSNLKFLEYSAQQAVTVASAFGPYKDTIEDGVTGVLVENNKDWYEKIRSVLDDKEYYNYILKNATELVHDKYNISKNYVMWQNAIEEVLERKPRDV
jgi:glycosyltransferase involved in cell wall biosynthesis